MLNNNCILYIILICYLILGHLASLNFMVDRHPILQAARAEPLPPVNTEPPTEVKVYPIVNQAGRRLEENPLNTENYQRRRVLAR